MVSISEFIIKSVQAVHGKWVIDLLRKFYFESANVDTDKRIRISFELLNQVAFSISHQYWMSDIMKKDTSRYHEVQYNTILPTVQSR